MEKTNKDLLFEEHIKKIKYRTSYAISETPKYRSVIQSNEQYDELPNPFATQDGQPMPTSQSLSTNEAEKEVPPVEEPIDATPPVDVPTPEEGMPVDASVPSTDPNVSDMPSDTMGIQPEPQEDVDEIQNDIIKHNIAAMQSINDKLESLSNLVLGLNSKLETLSSEVEEVKEPTNAEKLIDKKNVSHPYYYNLNDFWSGNWFDEKRKENNDKGIRQLPDGTYIADFDELPSRSKVDVQKSFNDIM